MRSLNLPQLVLVATLVIVPSTRAQDIGPDPADAEAVKQLLQKATRAMLDKDAAGFMSCCDAYVDCFFYDGTLVKGTRRIEKTLSDYFAKRPAGAVVTLDTAPRSYRVLSRDVMTVDWPATIQRPDGTLKVNTLTILRKTNGRWLITSFLQSVPYSPREATPAPNG
jgi:uncharacterized protein (TIGR02246 family)